MKCSVCGVEINEAGEVLFSWPEGSKGTPARLRARVCQYARKEEAANCINSYKEIQESECYKPI